MIDDETRQLVLDEAIRLLERTPTRILIAYLPVLGEFRNEFPDDGSPELRVVGLDEAEVPEPVNAG